MNHGRSAVAAATAFRFYLRTIFRMNHGRSAVAAATAFRFYLRTIAV